MHFKKKLIYDVQHSRINLTIYISKIYDLSKYLEWEAHILCNLLK